MNLGQLTAGYKEKAKQKITEARVGRTAEFLVSHLTEALESDTDVLLTSIKRKPHHGWPGRLLPAVGLAVEQQLLSTGIDRYAFDLEQSIRESQALESIGYGNPPRLTWRADRITFAFHAVRGGELHLLNLATHPNIDEQQVAA